METEDLALHTDFYQLNMMKGYWQHGMHNQKVVFDLFFRELPFGNGFAVFAGLERVVRYLENLRFTPADLTFLQALGFEQAFLAELAGWRFTGNLAAMREGEIVFPTEPLLRVEGRIFELQLIETALLNFVNYQTLVATKAARVKQVAGNDNLMEFGTRRAQEADAAVWGTRAAYIAGFNGTSNVLAGKLFGIPVMGTIAHSWVQMFPSELAAFRAYAQSDPRNVILLVDTYDTLHQGIPNAIAVAEELAARGGRLQGIRIDSGDLAYLSQKAREMLDAAGLPEVKIIASGDLDEHIIADLKLQNAKINGWGVGTKLITAFDRPALGGVYKLVAKECAGKVVNTLKISENVEKITTPGIKTVYRIVNRHTGKAEGDLVAMVDEPIREQTEIELFDPVYTYKRKKVKDFTAVELLVPVFRDGRRVYDLPSPAASREYHQTQTGLFWAEQLRRLNPQKYFVDLSQRVWDTKTKLLNTLRQ